jgi:heme exporter protein A
MVVSGAGAAPIRNQGEKPAMTAVLTVEKLTLARGGRTLCADLAFELRAGAALVLTGPNGAGKSSLLRTLAGLLEPVTGIVRLVGPGIDPEAPLNAHAHYVGHADALKGALTAAENLNFWREALGGRSGPSARDALSAMRLGHVADTPVAWLSAGQKRRAALARLLVSHRQVWLLDEPTTALDAAAQDLFANHMARHRAEGGMIVAATHAPLGLRDATDLRLGSM